MISRLRFFAAEKNIAPLSFQSRCQGVCGCLNYDYGRVVVSRNTGNTNSNNGNNQNNSNQNNDVGTCADSPDPKRAKLCAMVKKSANKGRLCGMFGKVREEYFSSCWPRGTGLLLLGYLRPDMRQVPALSEPLTAFIQR